MRIGVDVWVSVGGVLLPVRWKINKIQRESYKGESRKKKGRIRKHKIRKKT
jgi:hypothetical protein